MRVSEYCYDGTTLGWSIVNVLSTILRIDIYTSCNPLVVYEYIYIYINDSWDVKINHIDTYHRYDSKKMIV